MVRYQRIFDKSPSVSSSYRYPLVQNCTLDERNLIGVICSNLSLYFCDFFMSRLKNWVFSDCEFVGGMGIGSCSVIDSKFKNITYYWTGSGDTLFDVCAFEEILFQGSHFNDVEFKNCTFKNVKFACDNLGGTCYFKNVSFTGCTFDNVEVETRGDDCIENPTHPDIKLLEVE